MRSISRSSINSNMCGGKGGAPIPLWIRVFAVCMLLAGTILIIMAAMGKLK